MNRWFAAAWWLAPIAAGPAQAAQMSAHSIVVPEGKSEPRRGLNLRLIEDPVFAPGPIHNSGMIAQTPVGPNAAIGFGLLKVSPRKAGSGEFAGPSGSRKAAIRFTLKF